MDYYEILEVDRDAEIKEIRKSYKRLALRYHPDKNIGNDEATEKFKKISQAYQVLSNQKNRSAYDKNGNVKFDFDNPKEFFKKIFEDIPIKYIEFVNNFIIELLNSPECELTLKMFSYLACNENVIRILEIFKEDLNDDIKIIIDNFIYKLKEKLEKKKAEKENEIRKEEMIDVGEYLKKINFKKKKIDYIEDKDFFKNKDNDIEFNVNCKLEDIYNKVQKTINISRIRKTKDKLDDFVFRGHNYYNEKKKLIFPAHYRPTIKFKNEGNDLPGSNKSGDIIINIFAKEHSLFKIVNNYDLMMDRKISIYELYNGCNFTIKYFNDRVIKIRASKNINENFIQKVDGLGLPIPWKNKYGSLLIRFKVEYPKIEYNSNEEKLLFKMFPPINDGENEYMNKEEYLLDSEFVFMDEKIDEEIEE